ncbi:hypothetical protein MPNT_280030 [Candidatus Methylacidithermus pantelleriae]|uniref:Uncharacterized protein n=1 Tax=Candidatus Methylacidithermus pantelleriae TaxID=2744239 RepID=A0A8J2BJW8_9BACT|nr:hypothetical protein MPNT_280030 [Candidatus Methylacidithermus pantelleriae]
MWHYRARVSCAPSPELEGKIAWIGERWPELIEEVKEGVRRAQRVIRKLKEKKAGSNVFFNGTSGS